MKKLITTIFIIPFCLTLFGQIGAFEPIYLDSITTDLYDVTFINDNVGYIVGGDSTAPSAVMYYTSDGGMTWIDTNFSVYALWSVQFLDLQTGYVATLNANPSNLIFKTTDGGANWTAITTAINNDGKIYFKNDSIGFHYSTDNADDVAFTTDGGDTWTRYANGTFGGNGIAQIQFPEGSSTGYAITSTGGEIYKTTSDTAWSLIATPSNKDYNAMRFLNSQIGHVVGNDIIMETMDGGDTWQITSNVAGGLDLNCTNPNYCLLLNSDSISSTIDGFLNFTPELINDTAVSGLKKFSNFDYLNVPVIAVGENGKAYIWTISDGVNEINSKSNLSVYPNPVTNGSFTIKLSNNMINDGNAVIYNTDGRMVHQQRISGGLTEFQVNVNLPSGMYFLQLMDGNVRFSEKLLIGR